MDKKNDPVGHGYGTDTQRVIDTYVSSRDIEEYRRNLGFENKESFLANIPQGAVLLDIGSGNNEFSRNMMDVRPDVKIFNLNPALADKTNRLFSKRYNNSSNDIAAINPGLPYKDASFDVVLDCMASIYRADPIFGMTREESNLQKLKEVVRVLKPNGFAAVGPLLREDEIAELVENSRRIGGISVQKAKIIEPNFQSFHIRKLPL